MVKYGLSQSPITPKRLKPAFWPSTCDLAYLRHSCLKVAASTLTPGLPTKDSTLTSIGRPWQSQPGTYGESKPDKVFDLIIMSFKTLLIE